MIVGIYRGKSARCRSDGGLLRGPATGTGRGIGAGRVVGTDCRTRGFSRGFATANPYRGCGDAPACPVGSFPNPEPAKKKGGRGELSSPSRPCFSTPRLLDSVNRQIPIPFPLG